MLDHGRVAEFEAPTVLLSDQSSQFYSMALEAGLVQDANDAQDGREWSLVFVGCWKHLRIVKFVGRG